MEGPIDGQVPVISDKLQEQLEIMQDEIASIRHAIQVFS